MSQERSEKLTTTVDLSEVKVRIVYLAKMEASIAAENLASLMEYLVRGVDEVTLLSNEDDNSGYVINIRRENPDATFKLMDIDGGALVVLLGDLLDDSKKAIIPSLIKHLNDGGKLVLGSSKTDPKA